MSIQSLYPSFLVVPALLLSTPAHASGGGEQPETSFDCAPPHSEPYRIAYGTYTDNAAFELSTDLDVFDFHGEAGDSIRICLLTLNLDLDPRVSLYSPTNQLVAQDYCISDRYNLCSLCLDESDFLIGTTLPETGTYRILVEELGVNNAGQYTFQLERIPPPFPVRQLPYNTPTRDTLQRWTDIDYFAFCAQAGSLMRLSFLTLNLDIDPRVEIRAPDGSLVDLPGCNSDRYNLCSFTHDFTALQTGEYMLLVYDSGVNNYGLYELSVNCIVGCPPLASAIQRNGSGVNPLVYSSTCPPVLGGTWTGEVDASGHPGATSALVFAFTRPLVTGTSLRFGELLVDAASSQICGPSLWVVDASGMARCSVTLPCDTGLAGLQVYTQAVVLGGGPKLTNAVDLVIGY